MSPKKQTVKTMDELMERILEFAPDAEPYTDDSGKVHVDTGYVENDDGELERILLDADYDDLDDEDYLDDEDDDEENDQ